MESESKNIIQMLKNVKQIIDISKERNCWKDEELKEVGTTYHNVCEIARQLEEKDKGFEDITDDPVLEEPEPEQTHGKEDNLDVSVEVTKD